MRITGRIAQEMSVYAAEISDGRVYPASVGGDIGSGARVIDGNRQIVWLSKPRRAAAYYIGQVDAFREVRGLLAPLPDRVEAVRTELLVDDRRADVLDWYDQGKHDGAFRARKAH